MGRNRLLFAGWLGLWLTVAAAVCWVAWPQQIERGCWLGEWPFEEGCSAWPAKQERDQSPETYQRHVQQNVGDARAFARLLSMLWQQEDPSAPLLLSHVAPLAPNDSGVLAIQASNGLRQQDWPAAARALVRLVERGNQDARNALLALMLDADAQNAVLDLLDAKARWLDVMLASAPAKTPPSLLQPFVSQGHDLGIVKTQTVLNMIERLKGSGDWLDAYTLWVALRHTVEPDLSNPGFDQRSLRRGFDWEWPTQSSNRQGMRVAQVPASPRPGLMLEVELTARGALPPSLVGQTLLLLGDQYRLQGRFMSDRMRSKEGLAWVLRCAHGGERWAQTAALQETQRQWQVFELEFRVPPECSGVVRLQLEATAPWEARAGMSGVMYFDDLTLVPRDTGTTND